MAHDECKFELWTSTPAGWRLHTAGVPEHVESPAIGASLAVREVYARAGVLDA